MTAPKTSPAMGPEQQGRGGEQHAAHLGLVRASDTDREQVLGTCSPELIARLEHIRDTCITSVEKRAVQDCIDAARAEQVSPYMQGVLAAMKQVREHAEVAEDCECCDYVYIKLAREVWNELQEVR